jgi:hypothetical protein
MSLFIEHTDLPPVKESIYNVSKFEKKRGDRWSENHILRSKLSTSLGKPRFTSTRGYLLLKPVGRSALLSRHNTAGVKSMAVCG